MASIAEHSPLLLPALASLTLACAGELDPRGTWEGSYTPRPGVEAAISFEVGERWDYGTLVAHESVRWRVYGVEGHVEGWFDFEGGLFHCVLGPCWLNRAMAPGEGMYLSGHGFVEVEEGAFYVLGQGRGAGAEHCWRQLDVGVPWHVELDMEPARSPAARATGRAIVGGWCPDSETDPGGYRGEPVEGPAELRRIARWEEE